MPHRPLISVLLPSRGRPASLTESVRSLRDTADHPQQLEILVAADPDDPLTRIAAKHANVDQILVTEVRYGYARLHEYVNRLAAQANGDWQLLWNDDARMRTPGWDSVIAEQPPGVLWPATNNGPWLNTFPVTHTSVITALGHWSLSPHCDSWIQDVAETAGIHHRIQVEVLHDRFDLTGGHHDQTWAEAQAGYRTSDYHTPAMAAARARDAQALTDSWRPT